MAELLDISIVQDIFKLKQVITKSRIYKDNADDVIAELQSEISLMESKKETLQKELKYAKKRKDAISLANEQRIAVHQATIDEYRPRILEMQYLLRNRRSVSSNELMKEAEAAGKQVSLQTVKMIDEINASSEAISSILNVTQRTSRLCKVKAREYIQYSQKISESRKLLLEVQNAKKMRDLIGDAVDTYPPSKIQAILLEMY
jgi:hypothetical protein